MAKNSSVVHLNHLPYGFFERELYGYFHQFGKVLRVRVRRSKKGHANGKAFVEFDCPEVAEIAAETMDNFILAEKRVRCAVLKTDRLPAAFRDESAGGLFVKFDRPGEARARHAKKRFAKVTNEQLDKQRLKLVTGLRQRAKRIRALGINYTYNFEAKYAASLNIDFLLRPPPRAVK